MGSLKSFAVLSMLTILKDLRQQLPRLTTLGTLVISVVSSHSCSHSHKSLALWVLCHMRMLVFFHPCSRSPSDFLQYIAPKEGSALLTLTTFGCRVSVQDILHGVPCSPPSEPSILRSPLLLFFQGAASHFQKFQQVLTEDFSNFCSQLTILLVVSEGEKHKAALKPNFAIMLSSQILLQEGS